MTDPAITEGQATEAPQGTTEAAPEGGDGQSVASGQTTGNGPDTKADVDSFFDPSTIKGTPLESAYKQMQAAYTKKAQAFAANRSKIEAYEAFERDPQGTINQLAKAYGLQIVPQSQQQTQENWEPKTWDEVMSRARQEAKQEIIKDFAPIIDEVKNLRKTNIEKSLEEIDPQWKLYEDDMMNTLKEHPSLVKDPAKLYRMSVPEEVLMAKATKEALKKLQNKKDSAQVSGGSTTTKTPSQVPSGPLSFQDAVKFAQQQVAAQGLRRPT